MLLSRYLTGMVLSHCPTDMVLCCCLTGFPPYWLSIVRLLFPLLKVVASDVGADWMLICNVWKT